MTPQALWLSALAVLCWGAGAVFDKLALQRLPPKTVFFGRLYLMFVVLLAPMVFAWDDTRAAVLPLGRPIVFFLAGSVVFTLGGLYLYYMALARGEALQVVPLCAAYPLVTAALALAVLREPVTAAKLAGAALVVGGTMLLARSP